MNVAEYNSPKHTGQIVTDEELIHNNQYIEHRTNMYMHNRKGNLHVTSCDFESFIMQ